MKKHYIHGKHGRGYLLQKILDETGDWLARAIPIQGLSIGTPVEARGDTIKEAEKRLLTKLQQLESTR
jgi:hypothetical protein